jgi:16S rRNA (uracil1498-N3)-methyltransferase
MREGGELLLFNGRDGEWLARIASAGKKSVTLDIVEETRPQPPAPDLLYAFAPIKAGRLDYLVQKAVEMGAGVLQPVQTHHTQLSRSRTGEAGGQRAGGGRTMRHPGDSAGARDGEVRPASGRMGPDRRLIFCDEASGSDNPLPILAGIEERKLGLLVGPEGGFSDEERRSSTRCPSSPRFRSDRASCAPTRRPWPRWRSSRPPSATGRPPRLP